MPAKKKVSKKTFSEIKKALPDINSEEVEVISDTLDEILAIKRVLDSEGGAILLSVLKDNCSVALRKAILAAKKGEVNNLVPHILDYSANMDLLAKMQDVSLETELRDQLDEAVIRSVN